MVNLMFRYAKNKLANEIRRKVDEWNFMSGAQILCLVTYPSGENVKAFQ
jgi:hypothetical protein